MIVACGVDAVLYATRLAQKGALIATPPEHIEWIASSGFTPIPNPLVIYHNIVTCVESDMLGIALREAKRIAECLVLGRCLPPYTRVRLERVKRREG